LKTAKIDSSCGENSPFVVSLGSGVVQVSAKLPVQAIPIVLSHFSAHPQSHMQ